jgi:hypothetical protein
MNLSKILLIATGLLAGASAHAQLNIPVSSVSLEFPSISAVTISPGGAAENVLPTPFVLSGLLAQSKEWFCMDPLQRIYYNGSGLPAGSQLNYASTNPANFDLWAPGAPGLTTARIQDLADLFTAYWPTANTELIGGALQIAVWEVTNEFNGNAFNLSNGQFTATNNTALVNEAQLMLNSLSSAAVHNQGNIAGLHFLIDGTTSLDGTTTFVQDLVGFTPVPESSTYGIAAVIGLCSIVALRRRTMRRPGAAIA